ncbi:MAG: PQQ-binding-like beta-propeller repeat protein [Bacteriovorax sp.]|nr:PQQ-binding-like beta-propeller repeat protein [Bacteriovorax sp.]
METMDVLPILSAKMTGLNYNMAIIPTVLIPLTGLTVILSSIATVVAGWFGIKLKMEGPKQLLEVLLTKKILISAVILNFAMIGAYRAYGFLKTLPSPIVALKYQSSQHAISSYSVYENALGRVHSFNLSDSKDNKIVTIHELKEVWTQKLKKGAFRSGVISGNSIFFGTDDGLIHELDLDNGKTKRSFYIGTQVTTRPVIYNSHLYAGEGNHNTHHARIYSFDLKTGKFAGSFQTKGHTEGQPLIETYNNETLLFLTAGKDGLYAISPDSLKEKWHAIDGHLDATVSIENGVIYTGSGKEKGNIQDRTYATAYEFSTGKKLWQKELPLSNWMHPVIGSKDVCYTLGEIYFTSNIGMLHCLDKKTGIADFTIPFEAPLIGKPLIIKSLKYELAVISDYKGNVCAINILTKNKDWCFKTGNEKTSYAFSSVDYDTKRNLLWYASLDNGLFALDIKTGAVKTHWNPTQSTYKKWNETDASVTIKDDSLFVADIEGVIRKLNIK